MISQNQIRLLLMLWFESNARVLPWRETKNPYFIWISEIMLQQTRVEAVIEYYSKFITRLPTIFDLANVEDDELYKLWQGLGYYSRAKNLKKAAGIVVEQFSGVMPNRKEELIKLPGIGPYTAGAIASIAFDERTPAIDGNVMRVISRLYGSTLDITTKVAKQEIEALVVDLLPTKEIGKFNQALMELGATVCIPNGKPKCRQCPLNEWCSASINQTTNEIPVKSKKKDRVIEPRTVLLTKVGSNWLIRKRPSKGLLANLWEFPNLIGKPSIMELKRFLLEHHIEVASIAKSEDAKHIFSHIEWHMETYLVEGRLLEDLDNGFLLTSEIELNDQYSVPAAFSHCLRIINNLK